jgi:hypothetical protein
MPEQLSRGCGLLLTETALRVEESVDAVREHEAHCPSGTKVRANLRLQKQTSAMPCILAGARRCNDMQVAGEVMCSRLVQGEKSYQAQ